MSLSAVVQRHWLHAVTAVLCGLTVWRLGFSAELPAVLAFVFGGVLLAVIDWKVQRLPARLIYYTLAGVTAGLVFATLVSGEWVRLLTAIAGPLLFANAFGLIWFLGARLTGMKVLGFGDVRLAAVLGMVLGWYGLPYVLYGAIAGHVLAAIIVVATCIHRRKICLRYSFGPPLIAGTLAVVLLRA